MDITLEMTKQGVVMISKRNLKLLDVRKVAAKIVIIFHEHSGQALESDSDGENPLEENHMILLISWKKEKYGVFFMLLPKYFSSAQFLIKM